MVRFRGREIAKEKVYAVKRPTKIWDVNFDDKFMSKLVKTKTNSKHLIEYLDKAIKPLVLIMPKMSGHVKTFKVKEGDKDKNNKLMYVRIDDKKLLEKYKAIWTKIEGYKKYQIKRFTSL